MSEPLTILTIETVRGRVPMTLTVGSKLADRLIQEEIWAQTVWPEGEPVLSTLLSEVVGDPALLAKVLEAVRK